MVRPGRERLQPVARATRAQPDLRWLWVMAIFWVTVLVTLLRTHTLLLDLVYAGVGVAAVVAIVIGISWNRPDPAAPWWCFAAGVGLWVLGDTLYSIRGDWMKVDTYPGWGDPVYLLGYPFLFAGLVLLIRARVRRFDAGTVIDALTITAGLVLISWIVLLRPTFDEQGTSLWAQVVAVGSPLGDLLLVGAVILLLSTPGAKPASMKILLFGLFAVVAADFASVVLKLHTLADTSWLNPLWILNYVAWGACAMHSSMTEVSRPAAADDDVRFGPQRLALAVVAAFIGPVVLAWEATAGLRLDVWAVVVGTMAIFGLIIVRLYATLHRISEISDQRARLQAELTHRATHDLLTGLPNRQHVLKLIDGALARSRRRGELVGILHVALDGFKDVNSRLGQKAGDLVLCEVADRLIAAIRTGDLASRLGGDEFVVLLEVVADESAAVEVGQRIVDSLIEPFDLGPLGRVNIGASVGVDLNRDFRVEGEMHVRHADVAAYRAKTHGGNRVEVYDVGVGRELEERHDIESALRQAIADDDLVLYFQPVVDLRTGMPSAYEALVRWVHPRGQVLSPLEFIPVAEKSDLICDLDTWMLHRAMREFVAWSSRWPDVRPRLGVNLSERHLSRPRVLIDVEGALEASGLEPTRLVIDVTESAVADEGIVSQHLQALRRLGVQIAMDDFGTGYNAITRLQHLPIDGVKIDGRYLNEAHPSHVTMLRVMVDGAHAHGLPVVAEAVEHLEQLDDLHAAACEYAQGEAIARPAQLMDLPPPDVPCLPPRSRRPPRPASAGSPSGE